MINTHNRQVAANSVVEQATQHIEKNGNFDLNSLDLDLSGIKIVKFEPQINEFILRYRHLQIMYLVDCGIVSLEGFPTSQLVALDLSRNLIGDDSFIQGLLNCSKLEQVLLLDNKINKIETIFKLVNLKNLKQIDFTNNSAAAVSECSKQVFQKFQCIELVNGKNRYGVDLQLEDDQKDQQYLHDQEEEEVQQDEEKNQEDQHEDEEDQQGKSKIGARKKK